MPAIARLAAMFVGNGGTPQLLFTGNAANAGQYLYWDTVHPSSRVHDVFALRG